MILVLKNVTTRGQIPRDVIRINGDSGFNATNGVISGDGSANNPFIIANWLIDAETNGAAIYIGNTTKYFIIEDCILLNATPQTDPYYSGAGIILYNVKNGNISNNNIFNNSRGIQLNQASENTLMDNYVKSGSHGIYVDHGGNNTIENNNIENISDWGIFIYYSDWNYLDGNTINNIYGLHGYGIYVVESKNNTMEGNNLSGINDASIQISSSENNKVLRNIVHNNKQDGIYFHSSPHSMAVENEVYDNGGTGIHSSYSNYLIIRGNQIWNNSDSGIYIYSSYWCKIEGNEMENNSIFLYGNIYTYTTQSIPLNNTVGGKLVYYYSNTDLNYASLPSNAGEVILGNVSRAIIEDVDMEHGGMVVEIAHSSNITVRNNKMSNNTNTGIWVVYSKDILITSNEITGNSHGIGVESTTNVTIKNNKISSCKGDGIYISSSVGTIMDNILYKNLWGLEIYTSYEFIIENNDMDSNIFGGILTISLSDSIIRNNTLKNSTVNSRGGIYGLYMWASDNNKVVNNLIYGFSSYGVYLASGANNIFYNNSFYYNNGSTDSFNSLHMQAYDDGTNTHWNSSANSTPTATRAGSTTIYGNFWADWANNNDTNDESPQDGIVDWPYRIDGSTNALDNYPLKRATYPMAPSPPQNLAAVAGDGYVNLTWEAPQRMGSSLIVSYKIYRNDSLIATIPASQLWYNDTDVINGFTYTYYVTAVNSEEEGNNSNEIEATPEGAIPELSAMLVIFLVVAFAILYAKKKS